MTASSKVTGQPTDISNLCEFGWYEWVQFCYDNNQFQEPHEQLGRCLGPAEHAGRVMSQWVLNKHGNVLPIQTLTKLHDDEWTNRDEIKERGEFDHAIEQRHGTALSLPPSTPQVQVESNYEDGNGNQEQGMPDADDMPDYDQYINSEVLLPSDGEHLKAARVVQRVTDDQGRPLGNFNSNPILDTRVYEVMFGDGSVHQYAANIIAESLWDETDDDGHYNQMVDCIVDHRSDDTAIKSGNEFIHTKSGKQIQTKTTKGWYLKIQWTDGTTSWKPLREVKESTPVQLAEYAKRVNIEKEPAFS